ncbi:uncharacterized protein LOC116159635 [Photinus pyralis]|uniref:uncharacterized protein LOC116159635 n=1 Tax=Photinus pyralis TaxID=7054 RepID=UPI0012676BC3|nr:uncharacterized protein LOC116159635 [Photinus pyralis]
MANTGGPNEWKRRVLASAVDTVILYGCEVWGRVMKTKKAKDVVDKVQRKMSLSIASAYRTVSNKDLFVVARAPLLRLRVWARHERKNNKDVLNAWEEEWEERESWTKGLIDNLKS